MNDIIFRRFFSDYMNNTSDAVLTVRDDMTVISISPAARHILPGIDAGYDVSGITDAAAMDGGRVRFYEYDVCVTPLPTDEGTVYVLRFPKSTFAVTYDYPPLETHYSEMIESLVSSLYNPLTLIFSALELLSKRGGAGSSAPELNAIRRGGYRLLKTAQNLEVFSAAGRSVPAPGNIVNIDAAAFIKGIVSSVSDAIEKSGVAVVMETDKRVFVKADEQRLERIVLLLISNALKRSKKGGVIRISLFETPSSGAVSIWDEGAAQARGDMDRMFAGGTLSYDTFDAATAKLYIEQLSGTMVAASAPGGGVRITFSLPKGSSADALFEPRRKSQKKGHFEQRFIDLSDVLDYGDFKDGE